MPVPARSTNFPDVLDSRFAKYFDERYRELSDMIPRLYHVVDGGAAPTKDTYRTSGIGEFADLSEFGGSVTYDSVDETYRSIVTPVEYASGFQIERKLFDDGLYGEMDGQPKKLASSVQRTRQKHAAQFFNNMFSVDVTWNSFSENLAVCSDSHTTRSAGVSTSSGFDNLVTSALSAVSLIASRRQFKGFRNDRGGRISANPTLLLVPTDIEHTAWEIVNSAGKPNTANNDANFLKDEFKVVAWEYLDDVNNYALISELLMKDALVWVDRVKAEFAMAEELDTLIGKWRVYARWGHGHNDWRFILGGQVS